MIDVPATLPVRKIVHAETIEIIDPAKQPVTVSGLMQSVIQRIIWLQIAIQCIKEAGSVRKGIRTAIKLRNIRDHYRQKKLQKYSRIGNKIGVNLNAPLWPSPAFNKYVRHLITKTDPSAVVSLHTLVFAITKKCAFKCEHCCEWDNLNKSETLSREDIVSIINKFYAIGVCQLHLSGGEPLNRFSDILFILKNKPKAVNCWIYTTGYQLDYAKCVSLKSQGLTGVIISIDHHDPIQHDIFRGRTGAFSRAILAAHHAAKAGLAVTFSICATRAFITEDNLMAYAKMAKDNCASFIQILEPKAVGHYAGMDVTLKTEHITILEEFYEKMNYDKQYRAFPLISYHGYYNRRAGCAGAGNDYLYVDTDGDVHNCPFCQKKLFSVLHSSLAAEVSNMRKQGCRL